MTTHVEGDDAVGAENSTIRWRHWAAVCDQPGTSTITGPVPCSRKLTVTPSPVTP
ncbi:hypothetical protein ABZ464_33770 [Streptomyces sp. NPDC005820]|uniref:hypothetical protein n=1 Tax=Streptomyces sp. NPDC005820 TaxID=3157069 RepID=UPI0033EDF250